MILLSGPGRAADRIGCAGIHVIGEAAGTIGPDRRRICRRHAKGEGVYFEGPPYFCSSKVTVVPTGCSANNLAEFVACLKEVSVHSIHYHFIEARLPRKLETNDFSIRLRRDLSRIASE